MIPLMNYVNIDNIAHRSAQPHYNYQFRFIKEKLGIVNLIDLRQEADIDSEFCPNPFSINVIKIPIVDGHPPTEFNLVTFCNAISQMKPFLFHCEHGRGRTSIFSVIYSIVRRNMSLNEALFFESGLDFQFTHQKQLKWLIDHEELIKTFRNENSSSTTCK